MERRPSCLPVYSGLIMALLHCVFTTNLTECNTSEKWVAITARNKRDHGQSYSDPKNFFSEDTHTHTSLANFIRQITVEE